MPRTDSDRPAPKLPAGSPEEPGGLAAAEAHGAAAGGGGRPEARSRPYPSQYATSQRLKDGTVVFIRPIRPEDESLMVKFHQTLSGQSVYRRYFHVLPLGYRVAHERLTHICSIDYDREMVLVAEQQGAKADAREILGVGRLNKLHDAPEAEVAVLVSDHFQRRGLGTEMLRRLIEVGRAEGLRRIIAEILPENLDMQRICGKLGFKLDRENNDLAVRAIIDLQSPPTQTSG